VEDAADRRARLEHQLDRLRGALLRHLHGVDARAREARAARADGVVAGLQPAELEAAVGCRLTPQLVARADHLHLHAAAAGAHRARARQLDLGAGERPAGLVLDEAAQRQPAPHHDREPRARRARRERDAAERALLEVVVAHVEALVLARRQARGAEAAVLAGAHRGLRLPSGA
jgi:hypothetical protein